MEQLIINAEGLSFRELNGRVEQAAAEGVTAMKLINVRGQRYIGTGINRPVTITVEGTPGSDLAAFGNGPCIHVYGNGQEAVGNTLNCGEIIVHGGVNDVLGVAMRGGKIYVREDAGYRAGIHMKAYRDQVPVIIIGGTAQAFLGEYMAGGVIIVLGLSRNGRPIAGDYLGTGMHGGKIYLRGAVDPHQLGKEVNVCPLNEADYAELSRYLADYCRYFDLTVDELLQESFTKLVPVSHRPYGQLYVP